MASYGFSSLGNDKARCYNAAMPLPNILWYCTDQQRFDTIAGLGNPNINTPNLDRLVSMGTAFARCYTQSPICTPSRATFLTGRYPATHHVHRNGTDYFPASEVLVTRILADAGYDCGLAGKLHLSRAHDRIENRPEDGYRVYHWSHHPWPDWPEGHGYADWLEREKGVDPDGLYANLRGLFYGPGVPAELHQTTWCTEKAIEFITEKRSGPWLMSVNPFDPHPQFDPPAEYLERYDPATLPYPLFRDTDIEHQKRFGNIDQQTKVAVSSHAVEGTSSMRTRPQGAYDGRAVKACYYAMIELIDHQFGRIIDVLEETKQLENTLIIFTSDHGELLGDHGLLYKGCRFYEGAVHVPLIIAWPGEWKRGLRSEALVELVDLPQTILEAVGISAPSFMQGKSLAPIAAGLSDPNYHKDAVVCEYSDALNAPDRTHASMSFDGRYKTVVYHGHHLGEVYDLQEDPGEFNDLWNDPSSRELRAKLIIDHLDALMASSGPGVQRTSSF